jgi:AmmeMemoRadiSam system protein B
MERKPAVAGMFYPLEPGLLAEQVREFMRPAKTNGSCVGVVSPHAGYSYSGRTAAFAISSLRPAGSFIVLGPNHTGMGAEFSLMAEGSWETPLGSVGIDTSLASEILRRTDCEEDAAAHIGEHSIEVQLPFLQSRFKRFGFVPICIMNTDYSDGFMEKCVLLGEMLSLVLKENARKGKKVGIVASSDFSHYVDPSTIPRREKSIVDAILNLDVAKLFDALASTDASVCGYGPIAVLMSAAKRLGLKARDIHSSNSREAKAVSYRAIGFG